MVNVKLTHTIYCVNMILKFEFVFISGMDKSVWFRDMPEETFEGRYVPCRL